MLYCLCLARALDAALLALHTTEYSQQEKSLQQELHKQLLAIETNDDGTEYTLATNFNGDH